MNKREFRAKLPSDLVKFLKKEKALTKFINNTAHNYNVYEDISYITILNSMFWDRTPEGGDFWNNLYKKSCYFLK